MICELPVNWPIQRPLINHNQSVFNHRKSCFSTNKSQLLKCQTNISILPSYTLNRNTNKEGSNRAKVRNSEIKIKIYFCCIFQCVPSVGLTSILYESTFVTYYIIFGLSRSFYRALILLSVYFLFLNIRCDQTYECCFN